MLTPEILEKRLKDWHTKLQSQLPNTNAAIQTTPILLYQNLYTLLHELKTSISLSENTNIRALSETVLKLEKVFKKLAYDEIELPIELNRMLLTLSLNLSNLESLSTFIDLNLAHFLTPHSKESTLAQFFSQELPWDSLSKARANSCSRYEYVFWFKEDSCDLNTLLPRHEQLLREIFEFGGVPILRKLDAQNSTENSEATSPAPPMKLLFIQLAAFAKAESMIENLRKKGWNPFSPKAPSNF